MEIHRLERWIAVECVVANLGNLLRYGNRGEIGGAALAELGGLGSRCCDDLGLLLVGEHGVSDIALRRGQVRKVGVTGQHGHSCQLVVGECPISDGLQRRRHLQRSHLSVGEGTIIDKENTLG